MHAHPGISTLLVVAALTGASLSVAAPYREYEPMEQYTPRVDGDRKFSNTYPLWKDRANLNPSIAGNPDEFWRLNWKFMDPPFNSAVHGGHFALDHGEER